MTTYTTTSRDGNDITVLYKGASLKKATAICKAVDDVPSFVHRFVRYNAPMILEAWNVKASEAARGPMEVGGYNNGF